MLTQVRLTEMTRRVYSFPRVHFTFAALAVLAAYQPAKGQENLRLPLWSFRNPVSPSAFQMM